MTTESKPASAGPAELCLAPALRRPRLNTSEASEYLLAVHGVKIAPATLAKLRSVGGGAQFQKCGVTPVYPRESLDAWALARLGALKSSTSNGVK